MTGAANMEAAAMESAVASAEPLSREQFELFYNRTALALRAYIRRVSGAAGSADDLLQEAYVRMLDAPPLTEAQRKSYLYRTAINLIADYHRAQSRQRRWWERAPRGPEAVEPRPGLKTDLGRLFLLITPQERALLWLAYVDGDDHREMAAILGVKEKSVKVLLYRARIKMEKILREHGFEGRHEWDGQFR